MLTDEKINRALKIIQLAATEAAKFKEPVEVAYSGGKDSDVLLALVKMSGVNYKAIYKNTTIDYPGTIQHVRAMDVEVVKPKFSFFELVKKKGYPSMFRRFCCSYLKEYKILNVCLVGVRAAESTKRAKIYKTFEECRIYKNKERVRQYYPLYDWQLTDIIDFIKKYNISLAPHYYKEDGSIDYKRRLGCIACPLRADKGIEDYKQNPAYLRALLRAAKIYAEEHPNAWRIFNHNHYAAFVCNVFFRKVEYFKLSTSGMFGNVDCKQFVENYFNL